jgi:hypothetical protein
MLLGELLGAVAGRRGRRLRPIGRIGGLATHEYKGGEDEKERNELDQLHGAGKPVVERMQHGASLKVRNAQKE